MSRAMLIGGIGGALVAGSVAVWLSHTGQWPNNGWLALLCGAGLGSLGTNIGVAIGCLLEGV